MSALRIAAAIALGLVVAFSFSNPALAKKKKSSKYSYSSRRVRTESRSTYAIPFTCGRNDERGSTVRGDFATAISVTNLNSSEVKVRARLQLTEPDPERSDRIRRKIASGRSFLIDCETLLDGEFLIPMPRDVDRFFQGVLTIDSLDTLQVVVQSSAAGPDGGVAIDHRQATAQVMKMPRDSDDDEVEICHIPPGNPRNRHTIEVDEAAAGAHVAHGDYRGSCGDDD
jgi:hypothetical protein